MLLNFVRIELVYLVILLIDFKNILQNVENTNVLVGEGGFPRGGDENVLLIFNKINLGLGRPDVKAEKVPN